MILEHENAATISLEELFHLEIGNFFRKIEDYEELKDMKKFDRESPSKEEPIIDLFHSKKK